MKSQECKAMQKRKKKNIIIVIGVVSVLLLLIGAFWLGRMSAENRLSEKKQKDIPSQRRDNPPQPSP